eukprot:7350774-Prymnesium_polylepis.1
MADRFPPCRRRAKRGPLAHCAQHSDWSLQRAPNGRRCYAPPTCAGNKIAVLENLAATQVHHSPAAGCRRRPRIPPRRGHTGARRARRWSWAATAGCARATAAAASIARTDRGVARSHARGRRTSDQAGVHGGAAAAADAADAQQPHQPVCRPPRARLPQPRDPRPQQQPAPHTQGESAQPRPKGSGTPARHHGTVPAP